MPHLCRGIKALSTRIATWQRHWQRSCSKGGRACRWDAGQCWQACASRRRWRRSTSGSPFRGSLTDSPRRSQTCQQQQQHRRSILLIPSIKLSTLGSWSFAVTGSTTRKSPPDGDLCSSSPDFSSDSKIIYFPDSFTDSIITLLPHPQWITKWFYYLDHCKDSWLTDWLILILLLLLLLQYRTTSIPS